MRQINTVLWVPFPAKLNFLSIIEFDEQFSYFLSFPFAFLSVTISVFHNSLLFNVCCLIQRNTFFSIVLQFVFSYFILVISFKTFSVLFPNSDFDLNHKIILIIFSYTLVSLTLCYKFSRNFTDYFSFGY